MKPLAQAIDGSTELRPLEGYDDTLVTSDASLAVVGNKTAVLVEGAGNPSAAMRAALTRAEQGAGVPAARLAEAERDVGFDDPLFLATGDLNAARYLIDVGPAGDLGLPEESGAIVGANRDQSFTTTFGAQVARALYADSRFVRAVERAERELGISFEDEVLRQFDCPSVSIFEPPGEGTNVRFAARSCVNDPDRMRDLLPRLRPYLPAILNGLDGLGTGGLTRFCCWRPMPRSSRAPRSRRSTSSRWAAATTRSSTRSPRRPVKAPTGWSSASSASHSWWPPTRRWPAAPPTSTPSRSTTTPPERSACPPASSSSSRTPR